MFRCPQWAQKASTFSDPQLRQDGGGGGERPARVASGTEDTVGSLNQLYPCGFLRLQRYLPTGLLTPTLDGPNE